MPSPEKGDLSHAILRYLSSVGVHVRPGKLSPSQEKLASVPSRRLFGVPLHSLPVSAGAEGVPQFLVDACELLRLHLHIEGLFRKTGSVTRIKALKTRLEAGENCLHMALPCDMATLVKQFLRDLPESLVPVELQGAMCKVQQRPEEDRGPLTILLTCLLPRASACTLRYFFGFLQDVTSRCCQNKMDLANLAIIFTPNLFPGELCSKLDGEAEELLQTRAAVVELLITHASEIGTVPQSLLGKVQAALPDTEHKRQSPPRPGDWRGGEGESWKKRPWRRKVGAIVTEALSKFKLGRALQVASCSETKEDACRGDESLNNATVRTSFHSKRKASSEVVSNSELPPKKRRSALESEEAFMQPVHAGPVQAAEGPALVSSDSPSNPVSGIGSCSGNPRISTSKVRRRRSSCRKHPQRSGLASSPGSQSGMSFFHRARAFPIRAPLGLPTSRKHSLHTPPGCSPTPFEWKDSGRKSLLHLFFWGSKDPHLPSHSIKATEANGWFQAKNMVTEVLEGPGSQPSHQPKEPKEGSLDQSSDEDSLPRTDQAARETAVKRKTCPGSSPSLDGVSCGHQELALNGGSLGKGEGLLGSPTEAAPPLWQLQAPRRSLSWPEDLSVRDTAKRGGIDSILDEAAIDPGDCFSLNVPDQPGVEVTVANTRQVGTPSVHVTLADRHGAAHPENEPCDIPNSLFSSKPDLSEDHSARADGFRCLSKVPQSSLKRLTFNFQRTSSQLNEGPNVARPKRKGGRRFGRSLSHESGLHLQAKEETGCATKEGATLLSPMSPLQSFKAYGRQIFITHKHWAMAFVGLCGRKESASQSPQETEQAATDPQEPLLGCQLEGE